MRAHRAEGSTWKQKRPSIVKYARYNIDPTSPEVDRSRRIPSFEFFLKERPDVQASQSPWYLPLWLCSGPRYTSTAESRQPDIPTRELAVQVRAGAKDNRG